MSDTPIRPGGLAPTPADDTSRGDRLERSGRRWLLWSFVLCPCHLPWALAILAAVFGGTSLGVVINEYRTAVGITIAVLYIIGVGIGFRYLRQAKANGACRVRL